MEKERILLLTDREANRRLLVEHLGTRYDVMLAEKSEALDTEIDLGIVGERTVAKLAPAIRERRERESPVHLPFLLLANRPGVGAAKGDVWRAVDDVLIVPTEKAELSARVEMLLRNRRQSKQLAEQRSELAALSREKDELIRIAAHDLRAPASTIQMAAKLLVSETIDEDERCELLQSVLETSERLLALLNRILDIERLEHGRIALERRLMDPLPLLERCLANHRLIAASKQIELVLAPGSSSADIPIDPHRIEEVFNNLIGNAINYSNRGTTVTASCQATHHGVEIAVIDRGIGIPPDRLADVFDRFVRVGRPTGGELSSGLGLTIAKKLVELHDGEIRVDSELGTGSTFTVWLPDRTKLSP